MSFVSVFDRIRKEVVENGRHDLGIIIYRRNVGSYKYSDGDARFPVQLFEIQPNIHHEFAQIALGYCQSAVLGFGLSELQYLVDEVTQAASTLMNQFHLSAVVLWHVAVVGQVFQRTENQCERRAQFVSDVGKEVEAFFVQFLFLYTLAAFQFQ